MLHFKNIKHSFIVCVFKKKNVRRNLPKIVKKIMCGVFNGKRTQCSSSISSSISIIIISSNSNSRSRCRYERNMIRREKIISETKCKGQKYQNKAISSFNPMPIIFLKLIISISLCMPAHS